MSAHNRCIGSDARAFSHVRFRVFVLTVYGAAWIDYIGEHHGWTQKNIIVACDAGVNGNVVLDFHIPSQHYFRRDDHILTDVTIFSDGAFGHDVRKVPDFSALSNLTSFIDDSGWVGEVR
jgi:hypothetical protein